MNQHTTPAPANLNAMDAHPWLRPVTGLIGTWQGRGSGTYPTLAEDFAFEQEITFSHDGRPFLHYEAAAWLLDADGRRSRPSGRENGWWRVAPDGRVEALFTHPIGLTEICTGRATASEDLSIELSCDDIQRTPTAREVTASRRSYRLGEGVLHVSHQIAGVGHPLSEHLAVHLRPAAHHAQVPESTIARVPARHAAL
ncbi:FABP family protein [Streptomyces xanthochromogenes]|uniref:FABP family protein n=1 Tax=Streptomyces xanthochromogenes TaxID=67384 RepID=UPI00341EA67D